MQLKNKKFHNFFLIKKRRGVVDSNFEKLFKVDLSILWASSTGGLLRLPVWDVAGVTRGISEVFVSWQRCGYSTELCGGLQCHGRASGHHTAWLQASLESHKQWWWSHGWMMGIRALPSAASSQSPWCVRLSSAF